jgi:hypothetical protein
LKDSWCICESQRHDERFKKALLGSDCCFPYIFILYLNEAIGVSNVAFGNEFLLG